MIANAEVLKEFERQITRAMFLSLFTTILQFKKKRDRLTQQQIADRMGIDKSQVSRWLNEPPNWTLDTVADLTDALDVDLSIEARDRLDGTIYTPSSVSVASFASTSVPRLPLRDSGPVIEATGVRIGKKENQFGALILEGAGQP